MSHQPRPPRAVTITERVIYHCELDNCPACGEPLHLCNHYTWAKTVQELDRTRYVASRPKECRNPACPRTGQHYTSAAATLVTVPRCTYGLDVIAQLGWWRDQEHLSGQELYARVRPRLQEISRRQVDLLLQRYRWLLACAQRPTAAQLQAVVQSHGGVIVSLDGLEPAGGQEQLWVVREVLTGTFLTVAWVPRLTEDTLVALLQPVADQLAAAQCPVLATLSDKQNLVAGAVARVWPTVPHQWCQAHYLRQAAAPLQTADQHLGVQLRHAVRQALGPSLRAVAATAADPAGFSPTGSDGLGRGRPARHPAPGQRDGRANLCAVAPTQSGPDGGGCV